MNLKSLDRKRILRQILPSVFFMVISILLAVMWSTVLIPGIIFLLFIVHVILKNNIMGRILGVIFFLGAIFMMVVLIDDIIKGNATLGYLCGIFLVLLSFVMSILLVLGYNNGSKNHQG